MIKERNNQNISHKAFTLIEMVIVLIIMGIMLMLTVSLSWQQIQKIENKAVKESILTEMQTRYSRNLWSSSFGWKMYSNMDVSMKQWESKIDFTYNIIKEKSEDKNIENTFTNFFEIRYITFNSNNTSPTGESAVNIKYSPYKISCEIWEKKDNVVIVARINNNKDYCFEIKQKNCRLTEMSEEDCNILVKKIDK